MEFVVLLLLIFIGVAHVRIGKLQERVELLERGKAAPAPAKTAPATSSVAPTPEGFDVFKWLSTDWPMKLGAFLLLLAFGWLTSYAFINNWIGPMGRIVLGLLAGILIVGLGEWRIRKYNHQGAIFMALGAAVILISLYSARNVYSFFTPLSSLIGMFASAAYLGLASVRHKNNDLSIVGLLMGGLAPLLINSPEPNFVGLFSYLFVLCSGTLWIVQLTKSKVLPFFALLLVMFYGATIPSLTVDKNTSLVFAVLFGLLFYSCNLFTVWTEKKSTALDLALAIGTGILSLGWLNDSVPETWKTGIFALLGLVFFGLAYLLFRRMSEENISSVYLLTGTVSVGLALSWEFSGTELGLTYIGGATLLLLSIAIITKKSQLIPPFSLLLLPGMVLTSDSFDTGKWGNSVVHIYLIVLLSLALILLFIAYYLRRFKDQAATVFWGLGGFYSMALVWLSCNALIENPNLHITVALGIYTIVGLIFNLYGILKDHKDFRFAGGILIGLVVARLLLVDVWEMDLSAKIVTFFIIGALLISTAFFNKKAESNSKK